jgi:hypothetical protein
MYFLQEGLRQARDGFPGLAKRISRFNCPLMGVRMQARNIIMRQSG